MPVPRAPKKTAFVPPNVFRPADAGVGVDPICDAACGGETSGSGRLRRALEWPFDISQTAVETRVGTWSLPSPAASEG